MTKLDDMIRSQLAAHADSQPPVDAEAFAQGLVRRETKRTRTRLIAGSALVGVTLLVVSGALPFDITPDRAPTQPAQPEALDQHAVPVPGGVEDVADGSGPGGAWVLNGRGQLGRFVGGELRFGRPSVPRSNSHQQLLSVGPDNTVWIASRSKLFRLDGAGEVTGSTRFPDWTRQLEVGSGYAWRHAGGDSLTRIDLKSLATETIAVVRDEGDMQSRVSHDLAAGFGAAWVADGNTGEVVRVDAETLQVERFAIGPAGTAEGEGFRVRAYVDTVSIGRDEVWACCDDKNDLVALDPISGEVKSRIDLGGGNDASGGGGAIDFGAGRLWLASGGRYKGHVFPGLLGIDPDRYEVEGPYPLPGEFADDLVATSDGLLVITAPTDPSAPVLNRFRYSELADLPYPAPEKSEASLRGWLIILAVLAGFVILIFYLGREEEPDPAEA